MHLIYDHDYDCVRDKLIMTSESELSHNLVTDRVSHVSCFSYLHLLEASDKVLGVEKASGWTGARFRGT